MPRTWTKQPNGKYHSDDGLIAWGRGDRWVWAVRTHAGIEHVTPDQAMSDADAVFPFDADRAAELNP